MPCYGPLTAYRPKAGAQTRRLVFDARQAETGIPIKIPCGQCIGCKLERSRQWALRCMNELRQHPNAGSMFLTLTYNNENCPDSLRLPDYQNFMKRLREHTGPGLRFFGCGEYGERFGRPHYHIIIFNYRPDDTKLIKRGEDYNLYDSQTVNNLWNAGHHAIGDVSFDSCAYVARYCLKKITGPEAEKHYSGRTPEFVTMSRRPGLGSAYFDKYHAEIYAHDSLIVNGVTVRPPRYYDNKFEMTIDANIRHGLQKSKLDQIKRKRRKMALTPAAKADSTSRRMLTKELVLRAKLKLKAKTL
jgi:hypothetical protein